MKIEQHQPGGGSVKMEGIPVVVIFDEYMYSVVKMRADLTGITPGEFVGAAVHYALATPDPKVDEALQQICRRQAQAREANPDAN